MPPSPPDPSFRQIDPSSLPSEELDTANKPKRRNYAKTRARILTAAYECFAEHGYANAGIREIAAKAEVAPSLVQRYFGNKIALFEEALTHAIHVSSLFFRQKERFGENMAKLIAADDDAVLTAIMVLSIADPNAKHVAQRVAKRHVIDPLAEWLGPPDARARANNLAALLNGFSLQMRHLSSGKISPASIKWLARALQDIVDGRE